MIGSSGTQQGAGRLRGTRFLIFMDWQAIGTHPEWRHYEQLMKCRDLYIKTAVMYRNDKDTQPKYGEDLKKLKMRLDDLQREVMAFESIEGAQSIANDFLIHVSDLMLDLYDIQYREALIESTDQENYEVPE